MDNVDDVDDFDDVNDVGKVMRDRIKNRVLQPRQSPVALLLFLALLGHVTTPPASHVITFLTHCVVL